MKIPKLEQYLDFDPQKVYDEDKRKYIAEYTEYVPGGFMRSGYKQHRPDVAEAKWNQRYPTVQDYIEACSEFAISDWAKIERAFDAHVAAIEALEARIEALEKKST